MIVVKRVIDRDALAMAVLHVALMLRDHLNLKGIFDRTEHLHRPKEVQRFKLGVDERPMDLIASLPLKVCNTRDPSRNALLRLVPSFL